VSSLIVKVRKVKAVRNHPNADRLDLIQVKGWQCIVGRGDHKVGDSVVFIPPDSILPPEFIERFDISYLKGKNGRVGTVKLRGEYSEGLVISNVDNLKAGADAADHYGITKWEPPTRHTGNVRSGPPRRRIKGFNRYTKIENIKNYIDVFQPGEQVYITEKIHGTNFRAGWGERGGFFGLFFKYIFAIGSRNVIVSARNKKHDYYGSNVYAEIARRYDLKNRIPKGYVTYGEIYGQGIQDLVYGLGNGLGGSVPKIDVVFYDVWTDGHYLNPYKCIALLREWGLPIVPILYYGDWEVSLADRFAGGMSVLDKKTLREGCVIKPATEGKRGQLGRGVLKAISQEYLTRKKGTEFH